MNFILTVLSFSTISLSSLAENFQYSMLDQSCTDPGSSLLNPTEESHYSLSESLDTLTVKFSTQELTYSLTLVDESQLMYMAIPSEPVQDPEYFFVQVDESRLGLVVFTSDSFGAHCGGGMIATSLRLTP